MSTSGPSPLHHQDATYSSSQSSSNTLSSNASSSAHSDDKWYEVGSRSAVRSDLEFNGYLQDNSADSGIDATSFTATQSSTASSTAAFRTKDRAQWQDDGPDTQRSSDTPPLTPNSLVIAPAATESKEAKTPSPFPLDGDAASRSRC